MKSSDYLFDYEWKLVRDFGRAHWLAHTGISLPDGFWLEANFSGEDLCGANLRRADLRKADLRRPE